MVVGARETIAEERGGYLPLGLWGAIEGSPQPTEDNRLPRWIVSGIVSSPQNS